MLKQATRNIGTSVAGQRFRNAIVVGEAASAIVLIVCAGLLIRSLVELLKVPPGFDPQGVWIVRTNFNRHRYADSDRRQTAEKQIMAALKSIPGVSAAALTTHLPLADDRQIGITTEQENSNDAHWVNNALVSGNYFSAVGIPIKRGRSFDDHDTPDHPMTIVVNESMARRYWPRENAIGKRVRWAGRLLTVIGIAGDVHVKALDSVADPIIYGYVFQIQSAATANAVFVVRSDVNTVPKIALAARKAIWSVDSGLPVFGQQSMQRVIARSLATRRFTMLVLALFAAVALSLTVIGVYGVLSYMVAQRTQEVGVRLASGAERNHILSVFVTRSIRLVALGLVIGLLVSGVTASAMSKLLFGIHSYDPATFLAAAGLLILASVLASYLPARRASRVDPIIALRYE